MRVRFLGHACFELSGGGHRVVIDPFLSGNPQAKARPEELQVEAVLLTHGHGDHLGDTVSIAKRTGAVVVAAFELASYCQRQGCKVHPMHIGGSHAFPFGRVKLTPAFHGSGIEGPRGVESGGMPAGILITMDGVTVYHAGDTALFGDMELLGRRHAIDVALLPIGDNFTMGPDDAVYAAQLLKPRIVVPMHYNTFDLIRQDPHAFARRVEELGIRCRVLEPGESLEV